MIILTPDDIAGMMSTPERPCTSRMAKRYMRLAGAMPLGDSYRITAERFEKWRGENGHDPLALADRLLPPSRWTQPATQKRSALHLSFVYFIASGSHVKIGYTGDIAQRLTSLQLATPEKLTVVAMMYGAVAVERELHEAFAHLRIHGEWFRREGELSALLDGAPR